MPATYDGTRQPSLVSNFLIVWGILLILTGSLGRLRLSRTLGTERSIDIGNHSPNQYFSQLELKGEEYRKSKLFTSVVLQMATRPRVLAAGDHRLAVGALAKLLAT